MKKFQSSTPSTSGGTMASEPWYYGRISRDEADRLLGRALNGDFLVRDSESNPGDLSISLKGIDRNKHFKVRNDSFFMLSFRKWSN